MKIIYLMSVILLITLSGLMKRTEKKSNALIAIPMIGIVYMCYVMVVAFMLYLIGAKINSINVGIINFGMSAIIFAYIMRKRKVQHYYICKKDIIMIVILIAITVGVVYKFFGKFDTVRYLSDGIIHYTAARQFSINERLFKDEESKTIAINPTHMPLAYINVGLLMNSMEEHIGQVETLRLFLLMDAIIWIMCGYIFFYLIKEKINGKIQYIIAILITLIYTLGYPLHSLIAGFHYLNYGLLIISAIIFLINQKENINKDIYLIILTLLNVGIIFSYNLFVPIVYGAIFIYYINKYKCSKKLLYYTFVTLVIPGLMGIYYYFFSDSIGKILTSGIKAEGYIMRNTWSNFIIYIPFVLYYIYTTIRKDGLKKDILLHMILISIIQTVGLFYLNKIGKISSYYFFKMHYLLQLLILASTFLGMCKMIEKARNIKFIILAILISIIVSAISVSTENMLVKDEKWIVGEDKFENFTEVYKVNKWGLKRQRKTLTNEDFEILKSVEKIIKKDFDKTIVNTPNLGFYLIFDYKVEKNCIEKWNNNEKYIYYIDFKRNNNNEINLENAEVVFEQNDVTIYKNILTNHI